MTIVLASKPGLSSTTTLSIPKTWDPTWFRNLISNQLKGADVRNADGVNGIVVTGNIASPYATISIGGTGPVTFTFPVTISAPAGTVGLTINGASGQDALDVSVGGVAHFKVTSTAIQGYGPTAAGLVDMTPDTGTFTGTLTGCTTSPTATMTWTRVGKLCLLYLNGALTGTSSATTMTMTGLPAEIQPATLTQYCPTYVENNSAYVMGVCAVSASGTITFYAGVPGTAFTNAGTKGLANTTVAYLLN